MTVEEIESLARDWQDAFINYQTAAIEVAYLDTTQRTADDVEQIGRAVHSLHVRAHAAWAAFSSAVESVRGATPP